MHSLHFLRRWSGSVLVLALCAGLSAQAAEPPAKSARSNAAAKPVTGRAAPAPAADALGTQYVDGIAAVVNKDVVTLRELRYATQNAAADLRSRGIQVPDEASLRHQVLQRLILDRLEQQEAERLGIRVDDAQIRMAINTIAARNKISVEALRKEIEKSGLSWESYQVNLRNEIRMDRLRQKAVDSTIVISDTEVDAFLKEQQRASGGQPTRQPSAVQQAPAQTAGGPVQLALAQILVRVPERASAAEEATLRQKAEGLLARVKKGDDFASVAAAASDGPEALQGGVMGMRSLDGWPDLFVSAVRDLQRGQVSDLVRSGNGFHILKVLERGAPNAATPPAQQPPQVPQSAALARQQGPMHVTQTHARHILIKTSAVMSDEAARQRLEQVRQRLAVGGATFEEMAHQYSQDATAPQGGDLGWVNPGQTVPTFESAMNSLQPGQISGPVQSPFGWHLIKVEERREHDVADEYQRMQARQILFERRAQPAFEDWLEQLRNESYIDNRLEKQERIDQANQ